jgi:hypothetical protein
MQLHNYNDKTWAKWLWFVSLWYLRQATYMYIQKMRSVLKYKKKNEKMINKFHWVLSTYIYIKVSTGNSRFLYFWHHIQTTIFLTLYSLEFIFKIFASSDCDWDHCEHANSCITWKRRVILWKICWSSRKAFLVSLGFFTQRGTTMNA